MSRRDPWVVMRRRHDGTFAFVRSVISAAEGQRLVGDSKVLFCMSRSEAMALELGQERTAALGHVGRRK